MPKLTVVDKQGRQRSAEVPSGQRLVLAVESQGIAIGHRCGGWAKCTTCRVEFLEGEPDTMTAAEHERLAARELIGQYRLSCQIVCDHDMSVRPGMTVESEGWDGPGPTPETTVTPDPATLPKVQLTGAAA